ncbi:translocation/assembly module TamB domain-containing protein [Pontimicrobium aquaticum]|uniref:Translocation/assembly module TamB n=1 Tax=Pontimicrobium aquaticum TaxID=2565367 RepID=A0A4U0EKA5_9FLAO|nr:translocation/assembly module TamB [Pontimicrobium aquaticum]TJY31871.1 translocation/assembly module TamB [Pontimicrobium aquaticum]
MFIILVLLLSIPAVQTRLGKYATNKINEDFGTNINIEKVGLQFNGDVELKNIYIQDYKKDTLISINELNTSVLSVRKLIYDNKLTFGDVDIYGMVFNLKTYKGEVDTNLDVFVARFDEENPSKEKSDFLLSSSDISIYESEFRLTDENKDDIEILAFNDLNINATDFLILGPDVSARINKLNFVDSISGLEVANMTTNFAYTLTGMTFDFLQLKTPNSTLNGDLKFSYNREDLQHFVDKVRIDASFENSDITLSDLNLFYNEFASNQKAKFETELFGTLNNLTATNIELNTSGNSIVVGDIVLKNAFDKKENTFIMDANFDRLTTSYNDLTRILPNVLGNALPPIIKNLNRFTLEGKTIITPKNLDADVDIISDLGIIIADLDIKDINTNNKSTYLGNLVMDNFDLGSLINDSNVGRISFNVDVAGTGFSAESVNSQVKGDVFSIGYNNYEYERIKVVGNIRNKIFDGNLIANDPNFDLTFSGLIDFSEKVKKYDFTANVEHANLKALNFAKQDSLAIFKSIVSMNMNGSSYDDAYGNIKFVNTLYKNQNDEYYFKDFAISSRFDDNVRYIEINSPDIVEGSLSGKFVFRDIYKLLENSLGNIYTNFQPHDIASNQFINFRFNIYNKIAEVFLPELELGSNTYFEGHVESDAKKFNLEFSSPQIKLKDYFVNNIRLEVDNKNPLYNTFIEIDSLSSKIYDVSEFSLINVTKNDTLFVRSDFKGGKGNTDDFKMNLFYTINEQNKSVLGFKKSTVVFKDTDWFVNEEKDSVNKIEFDRDFRNFNIRSLRMSHENEVINLYGVIRDSTTKNINLDFKDVELAKITPRIDSLSLAGNVNGRLNIRQSQGVYIPASNVTIDNFKVNDFNLGSFNTKIEGNNSLTNYTVDVSLKEDSNESLAVKGNLDFLGSNSTINLDVDLNKFILNPLNPFGEGVITNIRGEVTGNAKVSGLLKRPQINGELSLDGGGLRIPYLNIEYSFEDETKIALEQQRFIFNNARLTDSEFFSRATLSGNINHVNFSNWELNLGIDSDRLLVLNTSDSDEALYYGRAFVNGNISVVGPTDQLVIGANVSSEEGTVFKIPLSDTESFGDNSYIHFVTKEEKAARLKGEEVAVETIKGVEMDFDLAINENAEIEIIMDKSTGSSIKGRGNGQLLTRITTNGVFDMYGDFLVTEGTYNFNYQGVIEKEFRVLPGGTLAWEGDPLKAQINIEAVYDKIQANPSVLLENPINRSIPVEVKIHLTDQLEKPNIDYDLRFPNVNSTLNSELQYRLNDKDSKELQVISLLVTGAFRNELSFGSQDAFGLVSDRLQSMLNEILSSEDGKLNLGVDLQLGQNTPDFETSSRVGVTLSTKLSDNILINGKVGVPIGGVSETVIAGDFEVEMLINEDRTLSLKFFNRENSIRYFGEQIGYTQGVGLSYNVEFDNLNELVQKIFSSKKKENKKKESTTQKAFPDYINFKSKDSINTIQTKQ